MSLTLSLVLALAPQREAQDFSEPIAWQRSLADALAEQQRTGLPLLIAVNMNGEVFNDRFRTRTYKEPDFIESTRGYICVVASPDRHTDRDYDSRGNRIECPEFPGCTCGEHIAIEPELFAKYFKGSRNAPRHLAVDRTGKILFDRFLDRSMQTAIRAIADHRGTPPAESPPSGVDALAGRRDAASRRAIEAMYRDSRDPKILAAAGAAANEPFDLLRLGLHGEDDDEFLAAGRALARCATPAALADLEHALARDSGDLQDALGDALARLKERDARAARLHAHLATADASVGAFWRTEWQQPAYEIWQRGPVEAELDGCERRLGQNKQDHQARLRLAIARLAFAKILIAANGNGIEFWLEDARNAASLVPPGELQPEARAVAAVATFLRGDLDTARQAALEALPGERGERGERRPDAWVATQFFETLIQLDTRAAYDRAADANAVLQPEVARTRVAVQLIGDDRWATEPALLAGIGLLEYAGLRREAREHLFAAVRRFRQSPAVHERWRARVMADLGAETMRGIAGVLAVEPEDQGTSQWFAGYAAIVVAEQHVRDGRTDLAIAAYSDSVERFGQSVAANQQYADSANHFAALALAGRAQARHDDGDDGDAVADLVRAAELRAATMTSPDGLGRTPRGIARRLRQALAAAGQNELAEQLAEIAPQPQDQP